LSIAAHKHHYGIENPVFIAARRNGNFSLQSGAIEITYNKKIYLPVSPHYQTENVETWCIQ
jgi:hypothetical protein